MTARRDYYSKWKEETFACSCGWTGSGAEMPSDLFEALIQCDCPGCDRMILLVGLPTRDDVRAAAAAGHPEAASDLAHVEQAEARWARRAASQLQGPDQLPHLDGDRLVFDFAMEKTDRGFDEHDYVLRFGDREVWREHAGYEDWQRFFEIKDLLSRKYGARFERLVPSGAAMNRLAGDSFSAMSKVMDELPKKDGPARPLRGPDGKPRAWWRKEEG